jgi:soluble lytic murein transglycosylase-like protein
MLFWPAKVAEDTERMENHTEEAEERTECVIEELKEDSENEYIEAALYASGYFREDVPLDGDTQAFLQTACEETGIPYELALAVIRQETEFRNITGDDGRSVGYMQVQRRWHEDRMARFGVTDLTDPYGNFRVGCDYLAELLGKYPLEEALTAYNSGKPGKSTYASNVLAYMEAYYGD